MRPVQRGASPQTTDFTDYTDAKADLVSRLGPYCSYCERRIPSNLAVEHIQPKGLPAYLPLAGRWDNFLLGCVNCNSTKTKKDVVLADVLLPDRDNTFAALTYSADGKIAADGSMAARLLSLVGLDKPISLALDANGTQVALDRVAQRMEVWGKAESAKMDIDAQPDHRVLRQYVVHLAQAEGFFSIWMTVFANDIDMRQRLIDAFPGTRGSGCFDPESTQPVCPSPNPDQLQDGAKY